MLMHLLERAAQAQLRAMAAVGGCVPVLDDALVIQTYQGWVGDGSEWDGDTEWSSFLRRLNRVCRDFRN